MISRRGLIAAAIGSVMVPTIATNLFAATELEVAFAEQLANCKQDDCLLYYAIYKTDGPVWIESIQSKLLNQCDLVVDHDRKINTQLTTPDGKLLSDVIPTLRKR